MYWNDILIPVLLSAKSWIVTLDVLKYSTLLPCWLDSVSWIVTLDVLKC